MDVLDVFHPAVAEWFRASFPAPTKPQAEGWPAIARGESTLLLAPTGSGKTLAAFLACIDRLMFAPVPEKSARCRVLYLSPLKALAVDVEKNLRAPLIGIAREAARRGDPHHVPTIAIRTGDTPARERARFGREPADILITTPESLYLLLTSNAREVLRSVETVIVDEIHALVPTKRGAHLALSLERLEAWTGRTVQRIGLSATQKPLDEVARFLGGVTLSPRERDGVRAPSRKSRRAERGASAVSKSSLSPFFRPVTVVDAGSRKQLELRIEVPVEDMSRLGQPIDIPSGPASQGPVRASIWTAIHPRLLELVKAHTSTLIFVNSRRVAERLAGALNELAGETLLMAHHGSIAREQRLEIEDNLKLGRVRGLVATSSLELGIDMGAIDLVVQIEAPPSVASGMQRIGRAGHQVDAPSRGVLFPKYRADLVACAALSSAMSEGDVEVSRYPRNPLDVLAQQIVAMVSMDEWNVDALFERVRACAPFAELSRGSFEAVLDMLAGRYVSDEFADLKPRITWDRTSGTLKPREGARRVAVVNGGTIPDRGLYGVFLAGAPPGKARVGELDEEMVFETRVGETFVLGASTWRIEEVTHDKVLVSPAPGVPGKMPFWHGDAAGRTVELGRRIGALVRQLRTLPRDAALELLTRAHGLEPKAAENLVRYIEEEQDAAKAVPDDRTILVERTRDELGDWRICVLTPLGGRVVAPWSMGIVGRAKDMLGADVETMWTNDGFVVRVPESDTPPDVSFLFPEPEEIEQLVIDRLGATALFAAKFRECASRALLLPRRRPGGRTPLWQQRRRASDLLAAASKYASFPIMLEAYRECLRDVFDLPALVETLRDIRSRSIRVVTVDSDTPTPFASAILFSYVANYIYEGDAPLAERRAQALAIDQGQLRELLGDLELRELLDADALHELEWQLQHLSENLRARSADAVHDLLLRLGDLTRDEVEARTLSSRERAGVRAPSPAGRAAEPAATHPERSGEAAKSKGRTSRAAELSRPSTADLRSYAQGESEWLSRLIRERRAIPIRLAGTERFIAAEDSARYRDAFGVVLPPGLPHAFLAEISDALAQIAARYARTHGPFTTRDFSHRYALKDAEAESVLERLNAAGRLLEGAFRPGGAQREWCDPEVLRSLRRKSLAKLRREIEPVEPEVLGRFETVWHGLMRRRAGLDAVLDAIEKLQAHPMPASRFERDILSARIEKFLPSDLDALAGAGEVVWVGVEPLGEHDGRIALYLTDQLPKLLPPKPLPELTPVEAKIHAYLKESGASFFTDLHAVVGGFPADLVDALWGLVWKGLVTNDTFHALRAYARPKTTERDRRIERAVSRGFRSRRQFPPSVGGRWSLIEDRLATRSTPTEWAAATAWQLLSRYGVVTREVAQAEGIPGGFTSLHDVFVGLEESGRIRRGYFVSGVGAMQFALPQVLDVMRSLRDAPPLPEVVHLAATDPASPYGALLKWPELSGLERGRGPTRSVGARVILVNGRLGAFLSRGGRQLLVWLPEDEPDRSMVAKAVAERVAALGRLGESVLIGEINGAPPADHPLTPFLGRAGFTPSSQGLYLSRRAPVALSPTASVEVPEVEAASREDAGAAEAGADFEADDTAWQETGTRAAPAEHAAYVSRANTSQPVTSRTSPGTGAREDGEVRAPRHRVSRVAERRGEETADRRGAEGRVLRRDSVADADESDEHEDDPFASDADDDAGADDEGDPRKDSISADAEDEAGAVEESDSHDDGPFSSGGSDSEPPDA